MSLRTKLLPAVGALAFLFVLLPAAPAFAHAALLGSTPAANSVVQELPSEVVLRFSEPISPVKDKIRVVAPDGSRADDGITVDGNLLKIKLNAQARGTYLVSYRVISADSHPVPGGFTFSYGAPSQTPVEVPQEAVDSTAANLIKVAKYVGYAGLAMLAGGVLVLFALWPARLDRRGARRLVWAGFGLVGLATVAGIYLYAPYTTGAGLFDVDGGSFSDVLSSQYGTAHLIRLAVLVVAAILVRPLLAGRSGVVDRVLLLGLAGIGALTWPLAGHPAASPVPAVSVVVDALHLIGASVWLGGLLMLATYLLRLGNERELGAILPIWSRWAGVAVSTVLLAGVVSALIEVGTLTALVDTEYGRLMLWKIGLVVLLLGAALLARRLTMRTIFEPADPSDPTGVTDVDEREVEGVLLSASARDPRPLRRVVLVELGIAAVVLAVTASLTLTTPARTAEAVADPAQPQLFSATLTSSLYTLQVEVDPAELGGNTIHLYAYTADGAPLPVVEWKATAALPSAGVEPIEIPMLKITDNHATGVTSLPTAGDWQLRFTLRISEINQASVTVTVPVK